MAPENNAAIVGSTMTPTATISPKIVTQITDTDRLSIAGQEVDGISHTLEIPVDEQVKKLASIYALESTVFDTLREIEEVKEELDGIYLSPVLSDPIVDPFFVDTKWEIVGFTREMSGVIFTSKTTDTAYLKVLSEALIKPGKYFIYIQIAELPSGKLTVTNQADEIIREFITPGNYALEVTIEQPTIDFIDFVVSNVTLNHSVKIDAIYIHHVKAAFGRYVDFLVETMLTGGSGFASQLYVQTMMQNALSTSQSYTNSVANTLNNDLALHETSMNNPHQVTHVQTGAAPLNHTHSVESLGVAPQSHTHTPGECGAASTNHTHTLVSLGAANAVHTHEPEDCGAAPEVHPHILSDITDIQTIYDELSELESRIQTSDISDLVDAHLTNYENPHSTTKAQVELGDVVNAPMATPQETIEGILENRYVNPKGDRAALDALLGGQLLDPTKLIPTPIQRLAWLNQHNTYTIHLSNDRLYKISIDCKDQSSLKKIGLAINTTAGAAVVRNNICMAKKQTLGSGEILEMFGWNYSTDNHFKLMLPTAGINRAFGELTLNTHNAFLSGIMYGYVLDEATGDELLDNSFPYIVSSGYQPYAIPEDITRLILYSIDGSELNAEIVVYELMQTTQEPNMVVDATPVGMVAQRYGDQTIPGWVLMDGSELSRTINPELWLYAQNSGYLKSELDWQDEVTATGKTDYFSSGNGTTTFRIPKQLNTGPMKTYMKATYAQIPDSDEILYRFIWEN